MGKCCAKACPSYTTQAACSGTTYCEWTGSACRQATNGCEHCYAWIGGAWYLYPGACQPTASSGSYNPGSCDSGGYYCSTTSGTYAGPCMKACPSGHRWTSGRRRCNYHQWESYDQACPIGYSPDRSGGRCGSSCCE